MFVRAIAARGRYESLVFFGVNIFKGWGSWDL